MAAADAPVAVACRIPHSLVTVRRMQTAVVAAPTQLRNISRRTLTGGLAELMHVLVAPWECRVRWLRWAGDSCKANSSLPLLPLLSSFPPPSKKAISFRTACWSKSASSILLRRIGCLAILGLCCKLFGNLAPSPWCVVMGGTEFGVDDERQRRQPPFGRSAVCSGCGFAQ